MSFLQLISRYSLPSLLQLWREAPTALKQQEEQQVEALEAWHVSVLAVLVSFFAEVLPVVSRWRWVGGGFLAVSPPPPVSAPPLLLLLVQFRNQIL